MSPPDVRKPTSPAAWWVTPGFRPDRRKSTLSGLRRHVAVLADHRGLHAIVSNLPQCAADRGEDAAWQSTTAA
jgi:hypothetical protein